jgi:hypothetical protein
LFDLPPIESIADAVAASRAVLEACSKGRLSPSDATSIVGLISRHVRILELAEIEARLSALEKEQER